MTRRNEIILSTSTVFERIKFESKAEKRDLALRAGGGSQIEI
jgi:hypothetical protein